MTYGNRQLIFSYHGQLREVFGPLALVALVMFLISFIARVLRGEADATVRYISNLNIAEMGLFFIISLLFLYYVAKFAASVLRVWPKPNEVRARRILADEKGVYFQDIPFGEPDFYRWKEFEYARGGRHRNGWGAKLTLHWESRVARIYSSSYIPFRVAEAAASSIRFARERMVRGLRNYAGNEQVCPPFYVGFCIPQCAVLIHQFGRKHFLVPAFSKAVVLGLVIGSMLLVAAPLFVFLGSGIIQGRLDSIVLAAPLLLISTSMLFDRALVDGVCSLLLGGGAVKALGDALLIQGTWVGRVDVLPKDWIFDAKVENSETGPAYQVILRSNATRQVLAVSPTLKEAEAQDCAKAINDWLVSDA